MISNETTPAPAGTGVGQAPGTSLRDRQELFATLYADMRRLAERELRRRATATLSPTTLLHETFLNVLPRDSTEFTNEQQFLAYAARAMRGLIVDHLRRRHSQKRGGEYHITQLPTELPYAETGDVTLEKLSEALDELATIDSRLAACVDLRFFCGLSLAEIAARWNVSERTVQRDWDKARVLLNRLITDGQDQTPRVS
jgi:RNA polymerase sigma factor (TIGR02999 family)